MELWALVLRIQLSHLEWDSRYVPVEARLPHNGRHQARDAGKLKTLCILCLDDMWAGRGQGGPVDAVIAAVIVAIIAMLGIYLFSEFNQAVTVTGSLAGVEEDLLIDAADALVLAVGGTGIAVTALLILWGAGR